MEIGDKIIWGEIIYTCWLINEDICHLKDEKGNGICMDVQFIINNDLKI